MRLIKVTIDRFEGEYDVCEMENRNMIEIEKSTLPEGAKKGDVQIINFSDITIDAAGTEKRKKEIEDLTKDLWD